MIDETDRKNLLNLAIIGPISVTGLAPFAAVLAVTSVEQDLGVGTWKVGDQVLKIQKPTKQAGLAVTGARIDASAHLQVEFTNPTAGSITPTASEVYKVVLGR